MPLAPNDNEIIRIKIPSHPKYISRLREIVGEVCQKMNFNEEKAVELKLAVNEAVSNIIRHAYEGQTNKAIFVYFYMFSDRLEIAIRDYGKKVQPFEIKSRDLNDVKDHGLGVFLMETFADEIYFDFTPSVGTEVKFIKYR
jgi:serine/threonine-protein kinase RsbW